MPSLYDKLKSAQPITGSIRKKSARQDCLIEQHRIHMGEVPETLCSSQAFSYISNGAIQAGFSPESLLFIDTETTGLSRGAGTVAFLIGFGQIQGQDLLITQVLMRDYPQESVLLNDLLGRIEAAQCLVTYNGSSFDLPLLQGRLTMNHLRYDLSAKPHLDLLHAARRIFKLRLGKCPLTRMEELIFGFIRDGDLPGAEVPGRYFSYLESQDESLLLDILNHNCQDILTLAKLFVHISGLHQNPLKTEFQQDLFSLGRVYEQQGHQSRAIACYKACSDRTVIDLARLRMAELYRRQKMDQEAVEQFEALRQGVAVNARVFISLAKIYEHRFHEPCRALEITQQGMLYCSEHFGFSPKEDPDYLDLQRRCLRLMRKVEKFREID